jgi:RNA polymerase primary sigma factor
MRQFKIIADQKTVRSSNFQRYTNEVTKTDIMSPQEEAEVAWKAREGDQAAIERLVKANLRFVISVAKSYAGGSTVKLDDLINEGNMGLVEAAHDFDPTTGFKFISYAVWHVRKNMLKYLTDSSRVVRLPQNKVQSLHKMRRIEAELASELGRDATEEEVIDAFLTRELEAGRITSIPGTEAIKSLKQSISADKRAASLEGNPNDDPDDKFGPINVINGDPLGTDHKVNRESSIKFLDRQLGRLNGIERDIVLSYHGIGKSQESLGAIADRYECSSERIRQRYKKSIKKLQIGVRESGLQLSDVL